MVDTDQDRYPTLRSVLSKITDESPLADFSVERIEIHVLASGDATYRVWAPKAEEPEGGFLPAATP